MVAKRAALVAVLAASVVLGVSGGARGEPVAVDGQLTTPEGGGGPGIQRDVLVAWNLSVDALFTAAHAVELARGKRASLAVSGLELVLTAPAVAFAAEAVAQDPHDYVMIGFTVWGTALLVHSVVMIVTHARRASSPAPERRPRVSFEPTLMRGGGGGFVVGGAF
jgi:hypothetical protein